MKIHQFVHTLNYGDAISGEAISIQRILQSKGIKSKIFSVHAHEKVKQYVTPWTSFSEERGGEDVAVIHHYSIASPLNELFLNAPGIKRAMIYHNLTPEKWFQGYNVRVVKDLEKGREELPPLLNACDVIVADSTFNAEELKQYTTKPANVLPLLIDTAKWGVASNAGIRAALKGHGGKNILHVGRIVPNKCLEDIIKAFYFYFHKINRESRLWFVGSDIDTEVYSFELRRLITELRLKEAVTFVGAVSDCELKAFYENADLYLCMSEHEGFCVPLIEAMHFGVPVIAHSACAVPETLGDAGILIGEKHPAKLSELMNIVLTDQELWRNLSVKGKERALAFNEEAFAHALFSKVVTPLQALEGSSDKRAQNA